MSDSANAKGPRTWFVELAKNKDGSFDQGGWAWCQAPERQNKRDNIFVPVIEKSAYDAVVKDRDMWNERAAWADKDRDMLNLEINNVRHTIAGMESELTALRAQVESEKAKKLEFYTEVCGLTAAYKVLEDCLNSYHETRRMPFAILIQNALAQANKIKVSG